MISREHLPPEKRRPLTKLEFAQLAVDQNGLCAKCGCKLEFEPYKVRDEHIRSLYSGGGNELQNRQLWCVPCTKPKDKSDAGLHKKIRDKSRKHGTLRETNPMPEKKGNQKIQSRNNLKKHPRLVRGFDGKVRERAK